MYRFQLETREEEIVRTISLLPKVFILLGGYAVSAISLHRFSVDCDILASDAGAREIQNVLSHEGYAKNKSSRIGGKYHGRVVIWTKRTEAGKVAVDLFIESLTARGTGASWSFGYAEKNSTEATVSGTRSSTNVRVPSRELLIAMKIHAGRDADTRDIVMLSEGVDWNLVAKHASRGDKKALLKRVTQIMSRMESAQFDSSLRAAFEMRRNLKPLSLASKKGLLELKNKLEIVP